MATIRNGWTLPTAPACKCCGATMRPLKDWYPSAPLGWACESCPTFRLDPIIAWPFMEAAPDNRDFEVLGFIVAQPDPFYLTAMEWVQLRFGYVRLAHALVDQSEAIIDVNLIGEWRFRDKAGISRSFILQKSPGSEGVFEAVDDRGDREEWLLSENGNGRYLCMKACGNPISYLIFRYELLANDEARMYAVDRNIIFNAIIDQTLIGKVSEFFGKSALISESPTKVRAYLEKHGTECFEKDASFTITRANRV